MSTGVTIVDRIITAITIQVQAVDGFGIQVGGIVRRDKSSPLGAVIAGVTVIQASVISIVIATVTNMDGFATSSSVFLFYHLPRPQSRKSLPGHDGGLGGLP